MFFENTMNPMASIHDPGLKSPRLNFGCIKSILPQEKLQSIPPSSVFFAWRLTFHHRVCLKLPPSHRKASGCGENQLWKWRSKRTRVHYSIPLCSTQKWKVCQKAETFGGISRCYVPRLQDLKGHKSWACSSWRQVTSQQNDFST